MGLRPATNQHFTLKQDQTSREHLQEFVDCYAPGKPRERVERFHSFGHDELSARYKVNLDITWRAQNQAQDHPCTFA